MSSLRERIRLAREESECEQGECSTNPGGSIDVVEQIRQEEDQAEFTQLEQDIAKQEEAIDELSDVFDNLEEQANQNDQIIQQAESGTVNQTQTPAQGQVAAQQGQTQQVVQQPSQTVNQVPAQAQSVQQEQVQQVGQAGQEVTEITPEHVQASQEALKIAMVRLGYDIKDSGSFISHEDMAASPSASLKLSNEGIKELAKKVWETIKRMFRNLFEDTKKLFSILPNKYKVMKQKGEGLKEKMKQIMKLHNLKESDSILGSVNVTDDEVAEIVRKFTPAMLLNSDGKPQTMATSPLFGEMFTYGKLVINKYKALTDIVKNAISIVNNGSDVYSKLEQEYDKLYEILTDVKYTPVYKGVISKNKLLVEAAKRGCVITACKDRAGVYDFNNPDKFLEIFELEVGNEYDNNIKSITFKEYIDFFETTNKVLKHDEFVKLINEYNKAVENLVSVVAKLDKIPLDNIDNDVRSAFIRLFNGVGRYLNVTRFEIRDRIANIEAVQSGMAEIYQVFSKHKTEDKK